MKRKRSDKNMVGFSKLPKPKLSKEEFHSIHNLNNNPNIIILKVDKGNATIINNTFDYESKMQDLLSSSLYKPLCKNPINDITNLVTKAIKSSFLDPSIQKRLISLNSQTPKIYGQPKIHKNDIPLRPIVSAIGAPTYALALFLYEKLTSFTRNIASFIKDSFDFVQKTRHLQLDEHHLMVGLDVVSLFTKIPIPKSLEIFSKLVDLGTIKLIELCLTYTFFTFKSIYYEQTEGTTMGSSLSPVVANIFMEHFETLTLNIFHLKPKCYFRFVDNTFVILPHNLFAFNSFLDHLNKIPPHI
jgi:hypothetical protein